MIRFTIPGEPFGKQRPRVTKFGTYTPEKTANYENLVKLCFRQEHKGKLLEGPLDISITAYYPVPKSTSKKKAGLMLAQLIRPTKKPDCDNIVKIVCDALNNIAYKDDAQVVSCKVSKFYSDRPRVVVKLEELI